MINLEQRTVDPVDDPAVAGSPIGSPRNFVLACIGLLSLLADEIPELLERSVQRGNAVLERAQSEANRRRVVPPEVTPHISHEFQHELSHQGLLTHHDFETLLHQMTELEQQIDQIAAQRAAAQ
jgi:polyhydroxyalkanoate synthesis regulator phasin